jgi:hypothetical protein
MPQLVADDTSPKSILTIPNASGLFFLRVSEVTLRFKLAVREHCDSVSSRIVDSVSIFEAYFLFGFGAFLSLDVKFVFSVCEFQILCCCVFFYFFFIFSRCTGR